MPGTSGATPYSCWPAEAVSWQLRATEIVGMTAIWKCALRTVPEGVASLTCGGVPLTASARWTLTAVIAGSSRGPASASCWLSRLRSEHWWPKRERRSVVLRTGWLVQGHVLQLSMPAATTAGNPIVLQHQGGVSPCRAVCKTGRAMLSATSVRGNPFNPERSTAALLSLTWWMTMLANSVCDC